jgi:hypothetical protein
MAYLLARGPSLFARAWVPLPSCRPLAAFSSCNEDPRGADVDALLPRAAAARFAAAATPAAAGPAKSLRCVREGGMGC